MTTGFQLHPRLAADTLAAGRLELCEVRLLNDSRFLWLVLVPRRDGITEVHQLVDSDQQQLISESSRIARLAEELAGAEKINIGALGNLVPQLHWHVIARSSDDACWPGPVWGCSESVPYEQEALSELLAQLKSSLEV